MKAALPILALTLTLALPATAAPPEDPALEALRAGAERGDVAAQYELGVLYEFGFHLPDHRVAALAWYTRAADQGDAQAAKRRDVLKGEMSAADIERAGRHLAGTVPTAAAP